MKLLHSGDCIEDRVREKKTAILMRLKTIKKCLFHVKRFNRFAIHHLVMISERYNLP